jgi:hypothetical protein
VGDLVNGEEEVLIRGGAEDVGNCPELPRPERRVAQEVGEQQLEGDDTGDDILGQGLGTAEFRDLESNLVNWFAYKYPGVLDSPRDAP